MPLILSGGLSLTNADDQLSLKHPHIFYENRLRDANCSITTSTAQENHEGDSVAESLTYDFWKPQELPATIAFTFTESIDADYCAIAAHTLTQTGCSVELQYYDGAEWQSLGITMPGLAQGNKVVMFMFDEISSNLWRLLISGVSDLPAIGSVYLGKALKVEQRIYGGHTPITLSKNTVIMPNKSESGQYLGRSIIREGASTKIALQNLSPSWVREKFQPFMESARIYPFFWAWRPADYPDEVAYCWVNKDIRPSNSGKAGLMNVSFSVEGNVE